MVRKNIHSYSLIEVQDTEVRSELQKSLMNQHFNKVSPKGRKGENNELRLQWTNKDSWSLICARVVYTKDRNPNQSLLLLPWDVWKKAIWTIGQEFFSLVSVYIFQWESDKTAIHSLSFFWGSNLFTYYKKITTLLLTFRMLISFTAIPFTTHSTGTLP